MSAIPLNCISPVDGRYSKKTIKLQEYFSEAALIKYRIQVEIEYFIALCNSSIPQLNNFPKKKYILLRELYKNFSISDAKRIKEIETKTNHDVKAVEYFIKEKFDLLNLQKFKEFIHFGLTSQDINNTAVPYSIKKVISNIYLHDLEKLIVL